VTEGDRQLGGTVIVKRAKEAVDRFYPPWPEKIEAMQAWLSGDVQRLRELKPGIETTVAKLEARALPQREEEAKRDRESHPRYAEWQRQRTELASLERAMRVRKGEEEFEAASLPEALQGADAASLAKFARSRVSPEAAQRTVAGEEREALAAIEAALAQARGSGDEATRGMLPELLYILSCARECCGLDAAAVEAGETALDASKQADRKSYEERLASLRQRLTQAETMLASQRSAVAELEALLRRRRSWSFATEEDGFLHGTLKELHGELSSLEKEEVAFVEGLQLRWARYLKQLESDPDYLLAWAQARAGVAESAKYAKRPIPKLKVQTGLWPIGKNPVTGLWEFYHLRSAWDGEGEPSEIQLPRHDAEGHIKVGDGTGDRVRVDPWGRVPDGSSEGGQRGAELRSAGDVLRVDTAQGGANAVFLGAARADARAVGTALEVGRGGSTEPIQGRDFRLPGRLASVMPILWNRCLGRCAGSC
jgi:hypothetical protein